MSKSKKVSAPRVDLSVSFDPFARAILAATRKGDVAAAKAAHSVRHAMQCFIDAAQAAGLPKTEQGCKALQRAIRGSEVVERSIMALQLEGKTWDQYARGAMRAFYHGAPWTACAFMAPESGGLPTLPWAKPRGPKASVSNGGTVSAKAQALIAELRTLGWDAEASAILDAILAKVPDFKEEAAE